MNVNAPPSPRRLAAALAAVTLLALLVRAAGLDAQPLTNDDELVGATARNFVTAGWPGPTMWHHPRLRDHLVFWSTSALGAGPWGLKVWSVLLGTLAVTATGALVWLASASLPAAVIAAALVALDPLHVDFSRQAIQDVYLTCFPVAAAAALVLYARRRRPWQLVLAGLFLALGLGAKWSVVFPVGAAVALTVLPGLLSRGATPTARAAELALAVAALVLLPVAIYVLTFWPWFGRGHDLAELVRFTRASALETSTHTGFVGTRVEGYVSELVGAWRWFLQPVWYVDYVQPGRAGIPPGGFFLPGLGNPVTWLATLPAAAWAIWQRVRAQDRGAGLLVVLWLAAYLPFALVPRPIWVNSAVAVVPFWAALVGLAAGRLWERARLLVAGWAAVAVAVAALLLLPATGRSFGPSDALVRMIVSPLALDPAYHPAFTVSGEGVGR